MTYNPGSSPDPVAGGEEAGSSAVRASVDPGCAVLKIKALSLPVGRHYRCP